MKQLFSFILIFGITFYLNAQWLSLNPGTNSHLRSVNFIDHNNGWIAGFENLINKTTDGGDTWSDTGFHGGDADTRWYSICAVNSNQVYACGSTWVYDHYDANWARTDNGGYSWDFPTTFVGTNSGLDIKVFFLNENYGWKVGYGHSKRYLRRTTTGIFGGWATIEFDYTLYGVYFIDQNTGWVAGSSGYIAKSVDGGESWIDITSGITSNLKSIFFTNSFSGCAVGYKDDIGIIIKTNDGGETWYQVNHPPTFSMHCVQFVTENIGWACGSKVENLEERGVILYTNDGGENWSEQYVCDKLSALYELFFIDEFTGWVVGYDGILLKTINAGGTSFEGVNEDSYFTRSLNIHPNPFTTSTTLSYELQRPEKVSLSIYNHIGQMVYQTQENQPQGKQQLIWNAEGFADGVYYYRLQVGDEGANGKMVKVR